MRIFHQIKFQMQHIIQRWKSRTFCTAFPSPKVIIVVLIYSAALAMLFTGFRMADREHKITQARRLLTIQAHTTEKPVIPLLLEKVIELSQNYKANNTTNRDIVIQKDIAKQVIRLHVVANSNSSVDQKQKLQVRDEILHSLQDTLKNADSPAQAEEMIIARLPEIEKTAQETLTFCGSSCSVRATLEHRYFPVKTYGDLTFPAGTYRALCIDIGAAEGKNWWCVLFPSLCFVDDTTATVPEESKQKLKERLTEEEYKSLESSEPEFRFALRDWTRENPQNSVPAPTSHD